MQWCDEEFFKLGAFQAVVGTQKILLAKGGEVSEISSFHTSEKPVFYLKDFFTNQYLAYHPQETRLVSQDELQRELTFSDASFDTLSNEDKTYEQDFAQLLESFGHDLNKVVLISRENYKTQDFKTAQRSLFAKSLRFGTGTAYGFWNAEFGICGSTPETLFTINGSALKTFALAGTAQAGQEQELLSSTKDRYEHQLVIDDLKEKLASFSKKINVAETGLSTFKNIIHLKTDVSAELQNDVNLAELTSLLSPTAALGGYPKDAALYFLKQSQYQKNHQKRYFGSAFGVTSKEVTQFIVMIRNVQWQQDNFYIESGGGVVPDSELSRELEEIKLKRSVIRSHYL